MVKSLRWRLQIWHALILSSVLLTFGSILYWQMRRTAIEEVNSELLAGARVLEGALRSFPPHQLENVARELADSPALHLGPFPNAGPFRPPPRAQDGRPQDGRPQDGRPQDGRPQDGRPQDGRPPDGRRMDGRGPEPRGPDGPRGPNGPFRGEGFRGPDGNFNGNEMLRNRLDHALVLPPSPMNSAADEAPYFGIFNAKGMVIRTSSEAVTFPTMNSNRQMEFRPNGDYREILLRGPSNSIIVVGRDARRHFNRLTGWMLQLLGIGCGVLVLGLVGGWWLTGRAIRPILDISQTATKVTAKNLAQRIDTSRMDQELRELGSVLNSMLGRLDQAFEIQTQFSADASHELRTPLAVLLSNCELAMSRERSPQEYRHTLEICLKAGTRMKMLVEDLLLLAKIDAGKLPLKVEPIDLKELALESVSMFQAMAANRTITIATELETTTSQGDANRLHQVINNLLANAIHYNRAGGTVTLRTRQEGATAILEVTDTGCGIPAEAIPKLFDRFYRVDAHRSRQQGGSGLGLAICKSIVDAHHGELHVQSQSDVGTTVQLRLPKVALLVDEPAAG